MAFDDVELDESHKVTVHCNFKKNEFLVIEAAEVVEGKAIFKFDARYITLKEEVHCSIYISKGDQSIDVRTFVFEVELSEIDKGSLRVAEVYDANYKKLLEDFESGGQMAVSQFEISANNNTSSKLSEIDTKGNQAIADFTVTADESLGVKLGEIGHDADLALTETVNSFNTSADTVLQAKIAEFEVDGDSAIDGFNATFGAVLDVVEANEVARQTAGTSRQAGYEGFDGRFNNLDSEKANKQQEEWLMPTLLNGWQSLSAYPVAYRLDSLGKLELKGVIEAGTLNSVAFFLPVGYRPKTTKYLIASGASAFTTDYW